MDKLEKARTLFTKYDLSSSDYFKHNQGWIIITLPGIEKIQAKQEIDVTFEAITMSPDYACVKAIATKGDKHMESFGSAKIGGFGKGTTMSHYVAEMAEKRALARVVLKMENLYSEGIYSESESEDWQDDRKELTAAVINKANNAILKGEKTAEEIIETLEDNSYIVGETNKYAWRKLKPKEVQQIPS